MSHKINVLVFADDVTAQRLYPVLQTDDLKIVGRLFDENKVLEEITKRKADIIVINMPDEDALLRMSQQIYLLRPRTTPIVLIDHFEPEMLHKLMQVGIHNVLPLGLDANMMQTQINAIAESETSRIEALESATNQNWKSKVITFFSSKGGVGKTSLAVNLAVELARQNQKVAFLDFDLAFGDADLLLRIDSQETVADLVQEMSVATVDTIRKYMTVHTSGVNILPAPNSPEYADNLSANQIDKIISTLRNHYDYLIVDTDTSFSENNLTCFDLSSEIFFVTGTDISTINRTKKSLLILESLVGREKIKLIVGYNKPSRIKPKPMQNALGFRIWKIIPYDDKLAVDSINLGNPYVQKDRSSALSKSVVELASELMLVKGTKNSLINVKEKKGSFFESLKSKFTPKLKKKKNNKKRRRKRR